ncbi:MAG: cyclic-phosphate processing receiver domain-containing protein [Bacilli bacterium]
MKTINVYADDQRFPPPGFVGAVNYEETIRLLEENDVNILSLDYNFRWREPNGGEIVKTMIERRLAPKIIEFHSNDPFGIMRMRKMLKEAQENGTYPKEVVVN